MSRMSGRPPRDRYQVVKISEEKHDVYDIPASKIGTITKSPDGWTLDDGTRFDQEKDAVRQIYEDAGRPLPQPVSKSQSASASAGKAKKPKVVSVSPGAKVCRLGPFRLDASLNVMRGVRHLRLVKDGGRLRAEGTRDKKVDDKTVWETIAETA